MDNNQAFSYGAPPAARKSNTLRNVLLGCGGLLGLVALCACAFMAFGFYLQNQEQQRFAAAHAAYESADCSAAMPLYAELLEGAADDSESELIIQGRSEQAECEALLVAENLDSQGQPGDAMLAYSAFIGANPGSLLAPHARSKATAAYGSSTPQTLAAQSSFCDGLDGLLEQDLIPDPSSALEQLYPACAQSYEAQNQFDLAAAAYQAFLSAYPTHAEAEAIQEALARAIVKAARAGGAGNIPAPQLSGTAAAGMTVVLIQNDSPEKLRIVFSGPVARIEEIAPCAECQNYMFVGPPTCPELGPSMRYELPPGTYDVVVESGSGTDITPWSGTWPLGDGEEYSSCFFVVTTSSP